MTQPWRPSERSAQQAPAFIPPRGHGQPDHSQSPSIALTQVSGDISPLPLTAPSDLPSSTDQQLDEFLASITGPLDNIHTFQSVAAHYPNPPTGDYYGPREDFTPPQNLDFPSQDLLDTAHSYDLFNSSTDPHDSISSGYQPSLTVPYPMPYAMPPTSHQNPDMAQLNFLTPPQSAPSDQAKAPRSKRPRAVSIGASSGADESQSEAAIHAKYFIDRQFQKLSGLATYKERPISSLLQWLREHLTTPEVQRRKRARTGGSSVADPSHAMISSSADLDSEFEALLKKEAGKVRLLADFLETPVQELLNAWDTTAGGQRDARIEDSFHPKEPRRIVKGEHRVRDDAAFLEFARVAATKGCRARTSTTNPDGVLKCLRSDCAGAYDKKKKSSWLRHVAQMVPDTLYACPRDDCTFIDTRPEWVVNHLQNKHAVADREEAKAQTKQEPFKVPFSGQCGWCDHTSNDWQEFFGTHVYNHLTGECGIPQATKEQWQGPYPPKAVADQKRQKRPSPGCRNKLWDSKRADEPDDGDDDDDPNDPPCPPGSGQGFMGTQVYSQAGPSLNVPNAGYSHSHQGQMRRDSGSRTTLKDEGILGDIKFLQVHDVNVPGEASIDPSPVSLSKLPFGKAEPCKLPFKSLRKIHQGSKSIVDAVLYEATGLVLARKQVHAIAKLGNLHQLYRREVEAMLRVRHTHVVKLVDYFMGSDVYTLVVQPVADFSLKQYLELRPPDSSDDLLRWQGCLASATAYLHSHEVGICHQDLKPANILIKDKKVHLADFGSSRSTLMANGTLNSDPQYDQATSLPTPMTPMYTPPEAYEQPLRGTSLDIYALGIVFLEMLTVIAHIPIEKFHGWVRHFTKTLSRVALATELQGAITRWVDGLHSGFHQRGPCPGFKLTLGRISLMTSFDPSKRPTAKEIATWLPDTCEYADGNGSLGQELPLSHKVSEMNMPHPAIITTEYCDRTGVIFGPSSRGNTRTKTESAFRIQRLSERGRCDSLLSTGSWCETGMSKSFMGIEGQTPSSNVIPSWSRSLASATTASMGSWEVQQPNVVLSRSFSTSDVDTRRATFLQKSQPPKLITPSRSQLKPAISIEHDAILGQNSRADLIFDRGRRLKLAARPSDELRWRGTPQNEGQARVDEAEADASDFVTTASSQTQLYLDKCSTGTHSEFWLETISRLRQKSSQRPWLKTAAREENREASEVLYSIMLHRAKKKEKDARSVPPPPQLPVQEPRAKTLPIWIENKLLPLKKAEQTFREDVDRTKNSTPLAVAATQAFYDTLILELAASLKLLIMLCGAPDAHNTALRRKLLQVLTHTDMQRRQLAGPQPAQQLHLPAQQLHPPAPQNRPKEAPAEPEPMRQQELKPAGAAAGPLSAFTIYAGEIQLVHCADDLRASDVKWHAWSSVCHNVPWRSGNGDLDVDLLAQLRYVARRYRGKHAALAGAALRGMSRPRGERGNGDE